MGFLFLILAAVVVVHYYLWRRLVRAATRPGTRTRRVLTWAVVVLAALLVLAVAGGRLFGMEIERVVAWPGYLWLAIMFYLFVFGLVMEIPRAVAGLVLRRRGRTGAAEEADVAPVAATAAASASRTGPASGAAGAAEVAPDAPLHEGDPASREPEASGGPLVDRRLFVSRTAAAIVGAGALATVGYGVRTALGDPVVERVPIRLPRLGPELDGLRVAVVSDIHLGPLSGRGHTERIVRMINGLRPDVVTIVGDLVDGTVAELGGLATPLMDLHAPFGSFFVTGNHEYYTAGGPQEWIEELRSFGVHPLRNERVTIGRGDASLELAGVNDLNGRASGDGPDLDKALAGRDPSRPVVLLAHQPLQVEEAAARGVDLQLSGHTHGGQMAPFNLLVPLQQPVVAGLARFPRAGGGDTQIYVTRGAGFWGPPVRVGAPPEITLIELHPQAG
ncbi:metallophosphoesterase [Microbispora corallina]|uniref:metallophosphoesterase n=1 Tax=Microbispora corallina TaxID=83302 RepID=UPI00337EC926